MRYARQQAGMTQINITPLTDVLLVLLITFLLSATAFEGPPVEVPLPQVVSAQEVTEQATVVTVGRGGEILWPEGSALTGTPEEVFVRVLRDTQKATLALAVHRDLEYEVLHPLLLAAARAGWPRVVVLTEVSS